MIKVGVTGGIGSGKSTVCAMLARTGIPVYYSDARARELMNGGASHRQDAADRTGDDNKLRRAIVGLLGEEAYDSKALNSSFVARKVFADKTLLASLNAIVHPAVADDFRAWVAGWESATEDTQTAPPKYVVLESAILFESGFDRLVDLTVAVSASEGIRLERAVARDGDTAEATKDAMRRMGNQMTDAERNSRADRVIYNDGSLDALAAEVKKLDKLLKQ